MAVGISTTLISGSHVAAVAWIVIVTIISFDGLKAMGMRLTYHQHPQPAANSLSFLIVRKTQSIGSAHPNQR
jgi:hypothetical protein